MYFIYLIGVELIVLVCAIFWGEIFDKRAVYDRWKEMLIYWPPSVTMAKDMMGKQSSTVRCDFIVV